MVKNIFFSHDRHAPRRTKAEGGKNVHQRNFRNTVHLNGQPSDAQKRGMLSLHVSLDDSRLDLDLAFDVASFFGLTQEEAEREAQKMLTTIKSQWRPIAATCGLKKDAHNGMAPAFALSEKMG